MNKVKFVTTPNQLWALLLGIHLVAAPFYLRIPVPVIMMVILFTIWVSTIALNRTQQPGKFIRLMLFVVYLIANIVALVYALLIDEMPLIIKYSIAIVTAVAYLIIFAVYYEKKVHDVA